MTRKIAMTTVRTVTTLLSQGLSYSVIRRQTGASKGFIHKVASVARADYEAFLKLSDEQIHDKLYPKSPNARTEPDWNAVHDLLQKKHMTLQLIFDEYCRANAGQKLYSYSSFCRRYADQKPSWAPQERHPRSGTPGAFHQLELCSRRCHGNRLCRRSSRLGR